MASNYDIPPHNTSLRLSPFKAAVPDSELQAFKTILSHSPIGPKTYENQQQDRRFGVTHKWLSEAKQRWQYEYDWRKTETRINSYPNFNTPINDDDGENFKIHFVALFSHKADAVPLVFLHGWPGSFLEFLGILDVLKSKYKPHELPYHVVVPSLPGYAYSTGPPLGKNWVMQDMARIVDKLMVGLGFGSGYVSQGGDIGATVARILAVKHPACKAMHLNFMMIPRPGDVPDEVVTPAEKKGLERAAEFPKTGNAYALEHGTRPATIGLVLSSSPIALLAWIGEKFQHWTDADPSTDTILDFVSLYWFTQTFARCIYPYRQSTVDRQLFHSHPDYRLKKKPMGFSWFPLEIAPVPKAWVEGTGELKLWRAHESGGHFAALEKPEVLLQDVGDFIEQEWPKASKL